MKKLILVLLIVLTLFGTVYFAKLRQVFSKDFEKSKVRGIGEERKVFIQEFEPDDSVIAVAPPKSLQNLRGFLGYIFSNSPNLFFNAEEQNKWLSADLQKSLERHLQIYEYGSLTMESAYFPDNSTFIGAWEYPSHYKIIDSRTNDEKVEIDIQYIWKEVMNYKGETRKITFLFVLENEDWKINDIYHHKSTYSPAFRLSDTPWDYWFR